ncbi:MAG: thioredoxin family protein [Halobacteriota archaeon]
MFFYRPTCPKCQATEPYINQLQGRYAGKVTVQRLNDDDPINADQISHYRVTEVPTVLLVKNGVEVRRWIGQQNDASAADIAAQIDSQLNGG